MPADMPNANEEDARTDLHAMIAASRELGPDMDKALVDSYMARQKPAPAPKQSITPRSDGGQPQIFGQATRLVGIMAVAAVVITMLVVSRGELWWFIFPLMWMGGAWGWWGRGHGHDGRHQMREEYRQRRRDLRDRYHYGIPDDRPESGGPRDGQSLPGATPTAPAAERPSAPPLPPANPVI